MSDHLGVSAARAARPVAASPGNESSHADLRGRAIRGGAVTVSAQFVKLVLNLGSTMILARLLTPADYGLIAMVTAFTSFVECLKDGGLSLATVQRASITNEQISTLFWLNVALGGALTLITFGIGPLVSQVYSEPRLIAVTAALAGTFLLSGLTVQHQALLRRNLRFTTLAVIDVLSMVIGLIVATVMAAMKYGYWALVGMSIGTAAVNAVAVWIAMPWRPGRAHLDAGVRPMIGFGGNIIGTRFIHSFIRHTPNILLGWWWGAVTVGIYQRAYALLMFAIDQIQGPIASVAISPLSRLQDDTPRLKQFFLTGYVLIISAILPVVATCAVYAEEIVLTLLGPQWTETAHVFRWLALSGIFLGLLHPQGMLLVAMGRTGKCMKIVLADALAMLVAYIAGVRFGAVGVAVSFLIAKIVICVPLTLYTFHGTPVSGRDVFDAVKAPLLATSITAVSALLFKQMFVHTLGSQALAVVGCAVAILVYLLVLLIGARKWMFYRGILDEFRTKKVMSQPA